jgi:hypothetical protein
MRRMHHSIDLSPHEFQAGPAISSRPQGMLGQISNDSFR